MARLALRTYLCPPGPNVAVQIVPALDYEQRVVLLSAGPTWVGVNIAELERADFNSPFDIHDVFGPIGVVGGAAVVLILAPYQGLWAITAAANASVLSVASVVAFGDMADVLFELDLRDGGILE